MVWKTDYKETERLTDIPSYRDSKTHLKCAGFGLEKIVIPPSPKEKEKEKEKEQEKERERESEKRKRKRKEKEKERERDRQWPLAS